MNRMDRINQLLKRELGTIIQREVSDPRVEFVSITHVKTSRDLRTARVYFSVLGDHSKAEDARKGLECAKGYIRKLIGARMTTRNTPDLSFHFDESIEFGSRIDETLKEINSEYQEDNPEN